MTRPRETYTAAPDAGGRCRVTNPEGRELAPGRGGRPALARAIVADYFREYNGRTRRSLARVLGPFLDREVLAYVPARWVLDGRLIGELQQMMHRSDNAEPHDWTLWRASVVERGLLVALAGTVRVR